MKIGAAAAVLFAVFVLSFTFTGLIMGHEASALPYVSASADGQEVAEESAPVRFTLAQHDGCVAVYSASDRENPLLVTDISLSSLRKTDRELIERGIAVSSHDEILGLLEDLGS